MKQLTKAIIAVMAAVKGVEKNSTIGRGNSQFKGVADEDVKRAYNEAMVANGLCILPIEINPTITPVVIYDKTYTLTQVSTKYKLMHESGESDIISGYGHGLDNADKGAGKATTYALKYALLYTFMTPVGKIDDSDTELPEASKPKEKPTMAAERFDKMLLSIGAGTYTAADAKKTFSLTAEQLEKLK